MENDDQFLKHIEQRINKRAKLKTFVEVVSEELIRYSHSIGHDGSFGDDGGSCQDFHELINHIRTGSKPKNTLNKDFDLLKLMLDWQIKYYKLSGANDKTIEDEYIELWDDHIESYNIFSRIGKKLNDEILSHRIDLTQPLAASLADIDKFRDNAKVTANILYKLTEEVFKEQIVESGRGGFLVFWIFHKDVIGNEGEWKKIIEGWRLAHYLSTNYRYYAKKSDFIRYLQ